MGVRRLRQIGAWLRPSGPRLDPEAGGASEGKGSTALSASGWTPKPVGWAGKGKRRPSDLHAWTSSWGWVRRRKRRPSDPRLDPEAGGVGEGKGSIALPTPGWTPKPVGWVRERKRRPSDLHAWTSSVGVGGTGKRRPFEERAALRWWG
ncbi:hypothetical protein GCM10027589_28280 [Actinocorallia lasiicapitis]